MDEKLEREKERKTGRRKSKRSVEESMELLEQLLAELEASETSLEDAFSLYEKGMKLAGEINERLQFVEEQIEVLEDRYAEPSL